MSFRDLRQLTESLRVLGYPQIVSLDSFREPNFKLVAELLIWLTSIYEPRVTIPTSIESEHDRISLIKTVSQIFITKQHIKLNTKKLYQADGYAVKELLKLINSLVEASKAPETLDNVKALDSNLKSSQLKGMRERVNTISRSGIALHEALGMDIKWRSARHSAALNQLELSEIEKTLRAAIKVSEKVTKQSMTKLNGADDDEKTIQVKIDKKQAELERNQKRLRQLKQLRPAYQDELEELETDLKSLYDEYCIKFRNSIYLESLLEEIQKEQPQKQQFVNIISGMEEGIGGIKLSSDELSSDEDDSLMNENRQLFRPGPNEMSDDDLSEDESEDDDDGLTNDEDDF